MRTTVEALAVRFGGTIACGDPALTVTGAAAIDRAGPGDVTFAGDLENVRKLRACRAGAAFVPRDRATAAPSASPARIAVDDPMAAFLVVMGECMPRRPRPKIGISPAARVSATARIGGETNVHPGATILDDVVIGEHCDIHPGVVIGAGCRVGSHVALHPNVVLYHDCLVGDRVIIQASAVIGSDGFGYRQANGRHERIPHFGIVRIEDDVEIGACTTIDRSVLGETVIGAGSKIDNLVCIAHNCRLGKHNLLVSQVGFAGSVTTGDYVVCAGQVGVADHVTLGPGTVLGGQAGAHKDLAGGQEYLGAPARPIAEARRIIMAQQRLPELRQRVRELEEQLEELQTRMRGLEEQSRSAA
ncbi:MAG: UDP-3-O-(3-hydroxymyristoyl)glucosamine N-acyltransferase [Planctomycetes bacterium]|nr:UDP-3-O-(3-hydroxymyristoyl)glucosamine N-acyltransferase [Planctomycetota bacterium]